tara:strand:- start:2443 stop:2592 length:150 start_codon:yes stop_codon:yes gene_type:complete
MPVKNLLYRLKSEIQELSFMKEKKEELPFSDSTFDVVCGVNSFQYTVAI